MSAKASRQRTASETTFAANAGGRDGARATTTTTTLPHLPAWLTDSTFFLLSGTLHHDISQKVHLGDAVPDLLCEPRVHRFCQLAMGTPVESDPSSPLMLNNNNNNNKHRNNSGSSSTASSWSTPHEFPVLNYKTAPAIASVFHFITLCAKNLPSPMIQGLLTEGAALFGLLMRSVNSSLVVKMGINLVDWLGVVVGFVVQLRDEGTLNKQLQQQQNHNNNANNNSGTSCAAGAAREQVTRSAFNKLFIDDLLLHALPSVPPAQWTTHQKNVVEGVVRGLRRGVAALCETDGGTACANKNISKSVNIGIGASNGSGNISPSSSAVVVCISQPLLMILIGFVEDIVSARCVNANNNNSNTTTALYPFSKSDLWSSRDLGISRECMTIFALVDWQGPTPTRIHALASKFSTTELLLDSLQHPGAHNMTSLVGVSLLILLSFESDTVSGRGGETTSPLLTPVLQTYQQWLAVLMDVDTSLYTNNNNTPAASSSSSSLSGTGAITAVRLLHVFQHECLRGFVEAAQAYNTSSSSSSSTTNNQRATGDAFSSPPRGNSGGGGGLSIVVRAAICKILRGELHNTPLLPSLRTTHFAYMDNDASSAVAAAASGGMIMMMIDAKALYDSGAMERISGLVQDILRLLVCPNGVYALLCDAAAMSSSSSSSSSVSGKLSSSYFSTSASILDLAIFSDLRAILTFVDRAMSHTKGLRFNTSSLGQAIISMATELLRQCIAGIALTEEEEEASACLPSPPLTHSVASDNRTAKQRTESGGGGEPFSPNPSSSVHLAATSMVIRTLCLVFPFVQVHLIDELSDMLAVVVPRNSPDATSTPHSTSKPASPAVDAAAAARGTPSSSGKRSNATGSEQQQKKLTEADATTQQFILRLLVSIAVGDRSEFSFDCNHEQQPSACALPSDINVVMLQKVLHVLSDRVCDAVQQEVLAGRTLSSASIHTVNSLPSYMSAALETLFRILADLATTLEQRTESIMHAVRIHIRNHFAALNHREHGCGSTVSTDDGVAWHQDINNNNNSKSSNSRATSAAPTSFANTARRLLEADADALHVIVSSVIKLCVAIGWPISGALYVCGTYRPDAQPFVSVGNVLQTLLTPLVALVASLRQTSIAAARVSGLLGELLDKTRSGTDTLERIEYLLTPPLAISRGYKLCDAQMTVWSNETLEAQAQQFRSFWLMLTMYSISSAVVDSNTNKLGISKTRPPPSSHTLSEDGPPPMSPSSAVGTDSGTGGGSDLPPGPSWLLGKTVSGTTPISDIVAAALASIRKHGEVGASRFLAQHLCRLAAVTPPLIHMRSFEFQQAFAEVKSFETLFGPKIAADVQRMMQTSIMKLCDPAATIVNRGGMNLLELSLLRTVMDVAALQASSCVLNPVIVYAQVELREFVSSKDLMEAIAAVIPWATHIYLVAVRRLIAFFPTATKTLVEDISVFMYLAAVGTLSVREASLRVGHLIVDAFPHLCAEPSSLAVLLRTLNVVQTGDEEELGEMARLLQVRHVAHATSSPLGTERQKVHSDLLKAATAWVEAARKCAPHRLFESAVKFILKQESLNVLAMSHYSGSELAARACAAASPAASSTSSATAQVADRWTEEFSGVIPRSSRMGILVLATSRVRNYANTVMRRSSAAGSLEAALRYAPIQRVELETVHRLRNCVRELIHSVAASVKLSERIVVKIAGQKMSEEALLMNSANSPASTQEGRAMPVAAGTTTAAVALSPTSATSSHMWVKKSMELFSALVGTASLMNTGRMSRANFSISLVYITQGPIQLFSATTLHMAVGAWKWLLFGSLNNNPRDAVELLSNICTAAEWTVTQRLGLFDGASYTANICVETGATVGEANHRASPLQSESEHVDSLYAADYATNSPHKILISFLAEHFVDRRHPISADPSVLRLLLRLAITWTREPTQWSLKDTSFSEVMRAVFLIFSIIENAHAANTGRSVAKLPPLVPHGCLVTLRSRALECLIRWFSKTPPSFYLARETPGAVLNEFYVLEELISILGREQDRLSLSQRGFLPKERDLSEALSVPSTSALRPRRLPGTRRDEQSDAGGGGAFSSVGGGGSSMLPISESMKKMHNLFGLLRFLLKHEAQRLLLWCSPRTAQPSGGFSDLIAAANASASLTLSDTSQQLWKAYVEAAAASSPELLVAFSVRFPNPHVTRYATAAVTANQPAYAHIPAAVDLYLHEGTLQGGAEHLYLWSNSSIIQSLRLLDATFQPYPHVVRYAIRSLLSYDSKHLIFFLPQLLQCFTNDRTGAIEGFFRATSARSNEFTHQLLWCLHTEGEGEGELARKCTALADSIKAQMTPQQATFYENEFQYISNVTALSGALKPVEKAKRKEQLRAALRNGEQEYHKPIDVCHLYLPTNTDAKLRKLIPDTAGAMQSAAKCPILVQFEVEERDPEDMALPSQQQAHGNSDAETQKQQQQQQKHIRSKKACIFKMGDDCRQDQIALQLIELFRRILQSVDMPCFLRPYRVVTTGKTSGIIECVPNALSRDQIGKLVESNIAEYFVQTYGHPQSPAFRKARYNFVLSMASYSVASYILNIKDRHNGNIMLDQDGHLIHIDFGFIFDYSPGGDINFESSPFKLTQEMLQLMGDSVTGRHTVQSPELASALLDAESYELFVRSTVLCYMAVRQYGRQICILVELMLNSGLPCFKPKKTIQDLAERLSMQRTEMEAASFMFDRVYESRDNMRTRLYDRYQNIAEGIEM